MISRLYIGLLLIFTVLLSFYYNLDYILLSILVTLISYDLYKTKILRIYVLFILLLIFCLCLFIPIVILSHAYILIIFFTILTIFNHKFKTEFFSISIYIFCIILFYFIEVNRNTLYLLILLSFFNDTVAYIAGRFIGGPLIIPKISPKKTWSGSLISFFMTSIFLYNLNFNIFILVIISSLFFFGDIFFSYIKRQMRVKDFSNILGGHGGILDRLDSMFFVAIVLQIYLVFIE
tara:strand:- start:834 stop:1535 length:702 start_codon:yes stop_codon:yes gene_type:complete